MHEEYVFASYKHFASIPRAFHEHVARNASKRVQIFTVFWTFVTCANRKCSSDARKVLVRCKNIFFMQNSNSQQFISSQYLPQRSRKLLLNTRGGVNFLKYKKCQLENLELTFFPQKFSPPTMGFKRSFLDRFGRYWDEINCWEEAFCMKNMFLHLTSTLRASPEHFTSMLHAMLKNSPICTVL